MALAITEDHRSLADVARSFVAANDLRRLTREALAAGPDGAGSVWKQVCELGWAGLHLPEEHGGSGYGLAELAVVVEQFGAVVAPGPFVAAVIGSGIVAACGDAAVRERLLPSLADGSAIAVFAPGAAVTLDSEGLASGSTGPVLGGVWADHLLIGHGADVLLVAVEALTSQPVDALDPSAGLVRFELSGAPVQVWGGAGARAWAIARALTAAEAAGGARAVLGMALDYAKVREQFGRIIGSFQAIKHLLANMLVEAERATAVAWDAARASSSTDGQDELAGAVAAAVALDSYQRNAQANIQILGGIGFTWEHDAHLYLRRALTLSALFGSVAQAQDDVLALATAGVRRQYSVDLPPEAEAFRASAQAFVAALGATAEADQRRFWAESGYLVPHWAPPWGRGADPIEQLVIEEELAALSPPSMGIGGWVLLTLTQHGTAEQIQRWVPPSLAGDYVWCQLFSEPGAGSDAAAVQTKAVRVEGGWRITGQKVWTSGAQYCHRGLATVRTDPTAAKHKGITAVVIDMHADGVQVRPLREITGEAVFNEVFFDNVFIPDQDVVGDVNNGWTVARATLGNERVSIGGNSRNAGAVDLIAVHAKYTPTDTGLGREVGRLIAAEQALRLINLRQVAKAVVGSGPGPEGNVTKLLISDHAQQLGELGMRIIGPAGIDGSEPVISTDYLMARASTIAGGTSEVTRNVIAERILGLPRDPLNK